MGRFRLTWIIALVVYAALLGVPVILSLFGSPLAFAR